MVLASLYWLTSRQENTTQIQVASQAQIDAKTASNVLRSLEKQKLVCRLEHETDTRAKNITLTNEGKKVLASAIPRVEGFDNDFFSSLLSIKNFNNDLCKLILSNVELEENTTNVQLNDRK